MIRRNAGLLLLSLFTLAFADGARAEPASADTRNWDFEVYLDGKRVGTHLFEVVDSGNWQQVASKADFEVKFLFISAYSYQHTAFEQWSNDCLMAIRARTNVNGENIRVSGVSADDGFLVEKGGNREVLPECVMTFAYWNPDFLKQERLLNPQTGELLDVDVESLGIETLEVRGSQVPALRYKLTAQGVDLVLWYSQDNEWLALESTAKGGRVIRYELS